MSFISNILGSLDGANNQTHQGDIAAGNATNASNAQNQLIQQNLLPIYNQLLQNYNQNDQPLQGGTASQFGGELGNMNMGGSLGTAQNALMSPGGTDAFSGLNESQVLDNDLNYLQNTGGTNLSSIGGNAMDMLATGAQIGPTQQQGQTALGFFNNEAQQGLSPATMGASINQYDNSSQQQINSMRNQLGSGMPNQAGSLSDLGEQQFAGRANLESQMAGQNQGFQNTAMQNAFSTAQGMDTTNQNMLQGATNIAGSLDQQQQQMMGQATATGQNAQQTDLSNMLQGMGLDQNSMTQLMQYLNMGQSGLTGATSGIQGLANQYGQAATGAAGQAQGDYNAAGNTNSGFISTIAPLINFGGSKNPGTAIGAAP